MSVRNTQVFNVPVVFHDVGGEDGMIQVVQALQQLDSVCDQVFNRISERVTEGKTKLQNIQTRIGIAQAKVNHIASSTDKATRVCATAKYPGVTKYPEYQSVYKGLPYAQAPAAIGVTEPGVLAAEVQHAVDTRHKAREMLDLFWKLSVDPQTDGNEIEVPKEGLGNFPAYLPSTTNLLLFNSTQNPYATYGQGGEDMDAVEREHNNTEDNTLAAAPTTLVSGDQKPTGQAVNFDFKPKMKELHEFELPEDLVDFLPNIVKDEQFDASMLAGESIAPSMFLPDLDIKQIANVPASAAAPTTAPPPPPASAAAPPPPPGPGPGAGAGAPPPPPATHAASAAPQAPAAPAPAAPSPAPAPTAVPAVPKPSSGKLDLMAAIRNAAGKTKAKPTRKIKQRAPPKAKRQLTIGEELRNRLARKRVAFAGREDEDKEPPKAKFTLKKAVTVVVEQNRRTKSSDGSKKSPKKAKKAKKAPKAPKMKKAAPAPAPAPPPPPAAAESSGSEVSSASESDSDSDEDIPDPNAGAPPPASGPRRMSALLANSGQLARLRQARTRSDTIDSATESDSD